MKTILLHIREDVGMESRFQVALDVVRRFDGHFTIVQAPTVDTYKKGYPHGGPNPITEVVETVRETEETSRSRIEKDLSNEGVSWNWLHFDGSPAQMLVEQGRLCDLIVVSQPVRERGGDQPLPIAADVALHARAPVLVVPQQSRSLDCTGSAAVAWNGSPESAQALRLARPMLRAASSVHIVTVGEEGKDMPSSSACRYLARHGIESEQHEIAPGERDVSEALSAAAGQLGAGYLVMGAYGHSRLRELILGGVTNHLLYGSGIPLVIAH